MLLQEELRRVMHSFLGEAIAWAGRKTRYTNDPRYSETAVVGYQLYCNRVGAMYTRLSSQAEAAFRRSANL